MKVDISMLLTLVFQASGVSSMGGTEMSEQNRELATIFEVMANVLDIQGENYHRVLAYRRAADSVRALGEPIDKIQSEGRITQIPGIGDILAAKIDEYLRTGQIAAYQKLVNQVPLGLLQILEIPGMGPRRTKLLWETLGISSVDEMEAAALAGQLRQIKGIGARTELKLLDGLRAWRRQRTGRIPLGVAWPLIQEIKRALRDMSGVLQAEPAGSLRRMRETVGDLDLLVAAVDSEQVMVRFRTLPMVDEVLLSGPTKTSIRTMDGIQVDLRVLPPERWGSGLQYFTGSQAHNIRVRALAQEQGLSLSEYGFRRENGAEIVCAGEEAVYMTLGLPWIPPELREDHGEIEAALEGRLPELVKRSDLLGDFQCHTIRSNGDHSLPEMVQAARKAGLHYVVVADHTDGTLCGDGMSMADLDAFLGEVAHLNAQLAGEFRVIAGAEVNIQPDGSLGWPDEVLARLDFVVASVHTDFGLPREQMTQRVLKALRNPYIDMIGHPLGRLLSRREGIDLDMEAVFQEAALRGVAMEINAWPQRLDLNDVYVRRAIQLGVMLGISSDAHDVDGFAVLDFGIAIARRGWSESHHILNTLTVNDVLLWRQRRLTNSRASQRAFE